MAIVPIPRPRRPEPREARHRAPGPASTPTVRRVAASARASVEPAVTAAVLSLAVGVATVPLPRLTT
jgi:hypothetical protein